MEKSEIKPAKFDEFRGEIGATRRARRSKGFSPFSRSHDSGGHFRAEPVDFLDWEIYSALRALGVSVRVAAREVSGSGAAEKFLALGARGAGADLALVVWQESERIGETVEVIWRSATASVGDVDQILRAKPGDLRRWHRDDGSVRHAEPLGLTAIFAVPLLLHWHIAVERARSIGIDLKPGSATLLEGSAQ